MAITPRTIFSSPASATIATVSLLAFSAVGTLAYKVAQDGHQERGYYAYEIDAASSCDGVREVLGQDKSSWSETDWLVYSGCFDKKNNSRMAATVAGQGLRYYPSSESLYNMKGLHEIILGEHSQAVDTLERGLQNVGSPSSGMMENNLAWAGLWVPREMDRKRARVLYKRALQRAPHSCETVHTGLWVEYAIAKETRGIERYHALKKFLDLRERYEPCQQRIAGGDWQTMVEVVGATVLFQDIDDELSAPNTVAAKHHGQQDGAEELVEATEKLRERYRGVSIDALCREAMPMANTHHLCVDAVTEAVDEVEADERAQKKKAAFGTIRNAKKNAGGGGGGGSNCVMAY